MASLFGEAFKNARKQGLDQFTFDGKAFTTELSNSTPSGGVQRATLPSSEIRTVESDLSLNPKFVSPNQFENFTQYPRSGDMRGNTNNFVQPNLAQNNAITDAVGVGDTAKNLSNNSGFMSSAKSGLGFLKDNQDSIGAGIKMAGSAIEYGKTSKALDEAMDTIDDSIQDLNKSIGVIGGKASQYTESVKDDASESQQFDAVNQFASIEKKDVGKKGQFRQKMVDVQNNINKKLTTLASVRQEKSNKAIEGIMAEATGVTESLNSNIGELNDEKDLMEDAKKNAKKNMLIDMAVGGATIGAGIIGGPGAAKAVSTIGGTAGDYFKSSNKYNV